MKRTERRLANVVNALADSGDKALTAKVRELEATPASLHEQRATWVERQAIKDGLMAISEEDLVGLLPTHGFWLKHGGNPQLLDLLVDPETALKPEEVRRVLMTLIQRIELDPKTETLTLHYRLPVGRIKNQSTGARMASPRGRA